MPSNPDTGRLTERNQAIWDGYTIQGKTLVELAAEYGVSNQRISQIIRDIRESLPPEDRQMVVDRRVAQIGAVVKALVPQALTGDRDAVASLEKMMAREAKYLGLDAPKQVEHSGKVATYRIEGDVDLEKLT